MAATANPTLRNWFEPDDACAIAEVHRSVYCDEYGFADLYASEIERQVRMVSSRGWPEAGGLWLAEVDGRTGGSLALTFEGEAGDGVFTGQVRWFALEMELRGCGLGRQMFEQLLETAEDQGMERLELYTFEELEVASRLYRSYGFELTFERDRLDWRPGGAPVRYQQYVLTL